VAATLVWAWLVRWRVGRHRAAIWKSLVLPAGGAALCWLLLMTLWMPLLDFVRSYTVVVRNVSTFVGTPACIQEMGLSREQIAAFQYHGGFRILSNPFQARCEWLMVNPDPRLDLPDKVNTSQWQLAATIRRPSDKGDDVVLYRRVTH
jgi:hypothetical protein